MIDFRNQPIRNKNCLWRPCLLMDRHEMSNRYRCFLPSFSSFGWGVSDEKIKMWKVSGRLTMDTKWWQKLTLPFARWAKNVNSCHHHCILIQVFQNKRLLLTQQIYVKVCCFLWSGLAGIVESVTSSTQDHG